MTDLADRLKAMLAAGTDNALLRFSLGSQLLKAGDLPGAIEHLRAAVQYDPAYSAAWKVLGKALQASGDNAAARAVYQQGIDAATRKGDLQAVREMSVFLRRLVKNTDGKD